MKKIVSILSITSILVFFLGSNIVQAEQINTVNKEALEKKFNVKNKVVFNDLSPEEMSKMKTNLERLKNSNNKSILTSQLGTIQPQTVAYSSVTLTKRIVITVAVLFVFMLFR